MKKTFAFLAVFVLSFTLSGCPKGAYHDAVVIEHDAEKVVKAYQQAVEAEFQNGRISQAERADQEGYIEKIGRAGQKMTADLQAASTNATITADLSSLVGAVGDLGTTGLLGIKNPNSQATLRAGVISIQAVLKNLSDFLATQNIQPAVQKGTTP
jgi:hypothetical protein